MNEIGIFFVCSGLLFAGFLLGRASMASPAAAEPKPPQEPLVIGATYGDPRDTEDPFTNRTLLTTVLDVQSGWVKYQFVSGGRWWSTSESYYRFAYPKRVL